MAQLDKNLPDLPVPSQAEGDPENGGLILPDQHLPPNLFILPVNASLPFPTLMAPIHVSSPRLMSMVEEVVNRQRILGILLPRENEVKDSPKAADLFEVGVAVRILKRLKLPDGSISLLVHSIKRFKTKRVLSEAPFLVIEADYLEEQIEKGPEMDAFQRAILAQVKQLAETNPAFSEEMRLALINAPNPAAVADLVAFALSLSKKDHQELIETLSVKQRFQKILIHLKREQGVTDLQKKISDEVNSKLSKMQRDFFLKEQLKSIKKELGIEEDGKEQSTRSFRERIESAGMPEDVKKIALEEVAKFETISEHSPEYNVLRNYLETLCSLPWSSETPDRLEIRHAKEVLDDGHYGLEKVKERILEILAVRKLKDHSTKGSIICLVGPPGVGKTSIGKSIAQALGRKFFRFSLGGMRDEAEIKGHRRTYVGALPGKVIQGLRRTGTKNCVLMLDEIDKIGASYQGDPASALLEVLDPEQNQAFLDHYLDVPFDLSRVLFIATANNLSTIPAPLLDRMEIIELPGYTLEEKEDIAKRYVIPRELEENGLRPSQLRFDRLAIRRLMADYAREPGLRILQQQVGRIARKAVMQIVNAQESRSKLKLPIFVREEDLQTWLGPKKYFNEVAERITSPGVMTGLAWTAMGGDILFIEATETPGTGQLKLTGQMGDVMTESANIAWTYVKRKLASEKGYTQDFFKAKDIHLHIPAGAVPKDGPSAGITLASALYSWFTGRLSRQKMAMTGELSLVGKVLPVGGIKEKLLAAKRAGITTVILPRLNQRDLYEIPEYALKGMEILWANSVEDVFSWALLPDLKGSSVRPSTHPTSPKRDASVKRAKPKVKVRQPSRSGSRVLARSNKRD